MTVPAGRRAWLPALFLFFFAPVSAEYLIGYDDIIDDPAVLVFGLLIFGPLYGAPAVLIREATRRMGRGWPTILTLGLAFGLVEAGLIDQSLFNPDYRDIPYWGDLREPTLIPAAGVSLAMVVGFLSGHMLGSIAAPIALSEALFPRRARQPWLGPVGLVSMAVLWIAAAAFVLGDTLSTESHRPSISQLGVTSLLVVGLVVVAFTRPRVGMRQALDLSVPAPLVVAVVTALLLGVRPLLDSLVSRRAAAGWAATLFGIGLILVWGALVGRWSSRTRWTDTHVLAAAAAAMLTVAAMAFSVEPLGNPSPVPRYAVNSVLFALVLVLVGLAHVRQRQQPRSEP